MTNDLDKLMRAERDVLRAALDRTNDQVAQLLGISPNTVATHMLAARRKLGAPTKGDAARLFQAWEAGHQNLPSPTEVMAETDALPDPVRAEPERVEEVRTPFDFASAVEVASPIPEPSHDRSRNLENVVLMLLAVTLLPASIHYLPDLATRAQGPANQIDPIHR